MCEPVSLTSAFMYASLAVTAATTITDYMGQSAQADAQRQVAEITQQQNAEAAAHDLARKSADLSVRQSQEEQATALRIFNRQLDQRAAASEAIASSESAGLSFDALLQDFDRQFHNFETAELTQLGWTVDQIDRSRDGLRYEYASRAAGQPYAVSEPSVIGSGLSAIASGIDTYNTFSTVDPDTGKRTIG